MESGRFGNWAIRRLGERGCLGDRDDWSIWQIGDWGIEAHRFKKAWWHHRERAQTTDE